MNQPFIQVLKIPHYLKNLFVFLPLFFSTQLLHVDLILNASLAFICFCLMASSVYIFNDIGDLQEDQLHPEKKCRPIAAGKMSIRKARLLEISLASICLILSLTISLKLTLLLLSYKVLNICYTLFLKKIAIADVLTISLGFVLRILAGSLSTGIVLSSWIVIMTCLLALLIALGKRRVDVLYYRRHNIKLRKVVSGYGIRTINILMIIISIIIILVYIMYTIAPESIQRIGSQFLFETTFWVAAGISRYLQLIFIKHSSDPPVQMLLKDHPLKLILLGWILNFCYFIYL
ncbi:UbiA prenyltransferase family protein [Mangrovibacterium lignilyticum]|uniref:UbiA prenyltransferase family protein n=1 Tax=Mangrovibacterium lignilyticum TaxID=2668052 RepID=UPI0013D07538|nr:UbiA prenyltransferase family protein [Mangrovibacterium lignilyticum]